MYEIFVGQTWKGWKMKVFWDLVKEEGRMLITKDKGFMQYRNNRHKGILIVRLKQSNRLKIHERTMKAITQFSEEEWKNLVVVKRDNIQSVLQPSK